MGRRERGAEAAAVNFGWLIWQAPLFFLEVSATTWHSSCCGRSAACALALLHVFCWRCCYPWERFSMPEPLARRRVHSPRRRLAAAVTLWMMRKVNGHDGRWQLACHRGFHGNEYNLSGVERWACVNYLLVAVRFVIILLCGTPYCCNRPFQPLYRAGHITTTYEFITYRA